MATLNDLIQELTSMLYENGDLCDFGSDESLLPGLIDQASKRYPDKIVRAVKAWMWWDLDVTDEQRAKFESEGLIPAIVFAQHLISDNSGRLRPGWNVKTTELTEFTENCFFITRQTVYILVGRGYRKTVSLPMARNIFF